MFRDGYGNRSRIRFTFFVLENDKLVKLLIERGADLNIGEARGLGPLHYGIIRG